MLAEWHYTLSCKTLQGIPWVEDRACPQGFSAAGSPLWAVPGAPSMFLLQEATPGEGSSIPALSSTADLPAGALFLLPDVCAHSCKHTENIKCLAWAAQQSSELCYTCLELLSAFLGPCCSQTRHGKALLSISKFSLMNRLWNIN